MLNLRPIFALILVVVTTFLVSCSSGQVSAPPPTYTLEKLESIQKFVSPIESSRQYLSKLQALIDSENWVDARTLIHGPLGQLRRDMSYLSRELLPQDQAQATQLIKDLFNDLEGLDAQAKARNYSFAVQKYNDAVRDFDSFLKLIPKSEGIS
ncbi:photosystem II protein PsbQ [Gloeocapsa sp. PCC 73106]|uniref:photosystem II protein PsbQ n=1 Tax=Gloeocapsa sp. PCC 73106 TaxID=102232 RepID=UPI0002ABEA0A|nr:photosystem II protein PsbQ [Gloeocapsa sp. PCC 73106]ELR99628.1 photosystem II protein PsbQ [Gloeocapsa sp. PCC 73106]